MGNISLAKDVSRYESVAGADRNGPFCWMRSLQRISVVRGEMKYFVKEFLQIRKNREAVVTYPGIRLLQCVI